MVFLGFALQASERSYGSVFHGATILTNDEGRFETNLYIVVYLPYNNVIFFSG